MTTPPFPLRGAAAALLAMAFLAVAAVPILAQAPADFLVTPDALAERLGQPGLVVLQVGPEELYREEHVPGAVRIELSQLSAPMPSDGRHEEHLALELPDPEVLRRTLEGLGVGDGTRIVVVPSGGWITPSARVLFTLDWAGLGDRVGFLDGGLEAWKAAGRPVTTDVPSPRSGSLTLTVRPDRVATVDWLREGGADAPGFALLDARAGAFYDGLRDDRGKSGHIPGAESLPWTELYDETEDGVVTLKPLDEVRALLGRAGVEEGDTVVAYCHIGQFATAVLLAARAAGHPVRLFDGSMNQWALMDLPVRAGGGR